jgi:hypothetical protein
MHDAPPDEPAWVSWLAGLAVVGVISIALLAEKPHQMATT